ncbi:MAG TPA: hypothetical protein VFC00_24380, partial [Micromonosporaceae bacterium]|nr:hypothetical protein [Micromonosporaceae bacterium]
DRFVDQTGRALERLEPAIAPVTDAFSGVLDAMGPALNTAIGDIATGMTNLANSVKANPEALAGMTRALGDMTREALEVIGGLNKVAKGISDFKEFVHDATGGMVTFSDVVGAVKNSLNPLGHGLGIVKDGLAAVGGESDNTGAAMVAAAGTVSKNARAMAGLSTTATGTVGPLTAVRDALSRQKAQFSSTIAAMMQWSSRALSASNAAIGYEAALDDATASIRQNGRTLDISSEKGRANRTALNQLAEAANRQTEAMDAAGASNKAVATKAGLSRAAFERLAVKMGLSKREAHALAVQLILIPNVSRTVTITRRNITYNDIITRKSTGNFEGGINARAEGGPVVPKVSYLVGEHGPEVAEFDRPGRIIPNRALRSAFAAGGGGGEQKPIVLKIEAGTSQLDQMLLAIMKKSIRIRGGNVQLVLGS